MVLTLRRCSMIIFIFKYLLMRILEYVFIIKSKFNFQLKSPYWESIIFLVFTLSLVLSIVLIKLNTLISWKRKTDREKLSPFECGYDPKRISRRPFSLHFYLLAIIFLIFDVEITIIIPMPVIFAIIDPLIWIIATTIFILILLGGAIHEWNEGSLEWAK